MNSLASTPAHNFLSNFSVAYISSGDRAHVVQVEQNQKQITTHTFEEFKDKDSDLAPQLIILGPGSEDELREKGEMDFIYQEMKNIPICSNLQKLTSEDDFLHMDITELGHLFNEQLNRFALFQNLSTLHELFPLLTHLKSVSAKDRQAFFEELWNYLRLNLGSLDLKIIYHDLEVIEANVESDSPELKGKKEKKGKLVTFHVEGKRKPITKKSDGIEVELMKEFKPFMQGDLEVITHDTVKGELVLGTQYKESPILILVRLNDFNELKKSLIKSLLQGLNFTF